MRFSLELSDEQLSIITDALDLYARIRIGQFGEVVEKTLPLSLPAEEYSIRSEDAKQALEKARQIVYPELGDSLSCSYGVCKFEDTREAYDILQVTRSALAWARHPEGGMGVDFDKPISFSKKPLPTCQRIDGD